MCTTGLSFLRDIHSGTMSMALYQMKIMHAKTPIFMVSTISQLHQIINHLTSFLLRLQDTWHRQNSLPQPGRVCTSLHVAHARPS